MMTARAPGVRQRPIEIRRITVPTDFSQSANRALDYAARLAKQFGASLHLIHVREKPLPRRVGATTEMPAPGVAVSDYPEEDRALQARLQGLVGQCRTLAISADGEIIPESGSAHLTIIEAAAESGADIIVMGSHGRTGLRRTVLQSVAEGVIRHAPMPVLVVPMRDHAA